MIPRSSVGSPGSAASGRGDEAFRPGSGRAALARAGAEAGPATLNAEFPVKFDQSVSFETAQQFARAVARRPAGCSTRPTPT